MEIGNRIRELRDLKGWSQQQMASRLDVTKATISLWESGRRTPSVAMLQTIASELNVSVNYLTGESSGYYDDPKATEVAQMLYDRPELQILFDCAKGVDKESILTVASILEKMK